VPAWEDIFVHEGLHAISPARIRRRDADVVHHCEPIRLQPILNAFELSRVVFVPNMLKHANRVKPIKVARIFGIFAEIAVVPNQEGRPRNI